MTSLSKQSTFLERAVPIVRLGFRVLPSGWATKEDRHPLVKDWGHAATRNRKQIADWSREFAVVRPAVSILVGDGETWALDSDEPEWLGKPLPRTATARSGGGGLHLYFRLDSYARKAFADLPNKPYVRGLKRDKAVELFAKTPHPLLAPGTVHYRTGQKYEWIRETKPVAAPRKFVDYIAALPWATETRRVKGDGAPGLWTSESLEDCLVALGVEYERGRYEDQFRVRCPGGCNESLTDKSIVGIYEGHRYFKCFRCDRRDFFHVHDPLKLLFSLDSWLVEQDRRVRKEFLHGKA